jgi:hypothetical protein
MKAMLAFVTILLWGAEIGATTLLASDDFDDDYKDPQLWSSPDSVEGKGLLSETHTRLEYTTDATAHPATSSREWVGLTPTYDTSWVVQSSLWNYSNVDGFDLTSFGIEIGDDRDDGDLVFAEMYATGDESPSGSVKGFYFEGFEEDVSSVFDDSLDLAVTSGAIRIAHDAQTRLLTISYATSAESGTEPESWMTLGSFGIDGSEGTSGATDWEMAEDDSFYVLVYGYSDGLDVISGELHGDDFKITTSVPEPSRQLLGITCLVSLAEMARRRSRRFRAERPSRLRNPYAVVA